MVPSQKSALHCVGFALALPVWRAPGAAARPSAWVRAPIAKHAGDDARPIARRDADERLAQPCVCGLVRHKGPTFGLRLLAPPFVLDVEHVEHAGPLRLIERGADLRNRSLGAGEDRGMLGKHHPGLASSSLNIAATLARQLQNRTGVIGIEPPGAISPSRIARDSKTTVTVAADGCEPELTDIIGHRFR
jgi:hypothetical protein